MDALLLSGSAHPALSASVARALGVDLASSEVQRHPDGELFVRITVPVRNRPVFIVQPLVAPAGEAMLELLLFADAAHRAGARSVTAVVPYVSYARQDRRPREGDAVAARVVADALAAGRFRDIVAVDLHSATFEGASQLPVQHLTAVGLLANHLQGDALDDAVVVSPDLGGVKLAEAYAAKLGLPLAIVHKTRVSGAEVKAHGVVGSVAGKRPIFVDDLVSTGGTIAAAVGAVLAEGARPEVMLAATHALLVGDAVQKLAKAGVRRFVTTDSLPTQPVKAFSLEVVSLAGHLADAIRRLANGESLDGLLTGR